jgi:hypothetical protein
MGKKKKKNNNTMSIWDYTTKSNSEKFAQAFSHNDNRFASCYCENCFHKLGDIEFKQTYFVKIVSKNIPTSKLDQMMPNVPRLEEFMTECPKCSPDRPTNHVILDYNIGKVIQLLNRLNLRTMFCCEGHITNTGFEQPYILFYDNVSRYFDMDNELLKWWRIENFITETPATRSRLCITFDAPMSYVVNGSHIDDLYKYIKKYIKESK